MTEPLLVIANKAYSSWSLRPWIAMRAAGIPFREELVPLYQPDTAARIARHSPAGRVPVLIDGDAVLWESAAILEHLNEKHPGANLWPRDPAARALARSIANEMHAGFGPLREALSMNLRRPPAPTPMSEAVRANAARITAIWEDALARFGATGGGGPFLFGAFGAADAMFAPVVARFHHYAVDLPSASRAYVDALRALPAYREWEAAAHAETWHHEGYERPVGT